MASKDIPPHLRNAKGISAVLREMIHTCSERGSAPEPAVWDGIKILVADLEAELADLGVSMGDLAPGGAPVLSPPKSGRVRELRSGAAAETEEAQQAPVRRTTKARQG